MPLSDSVIFNDIIDLFNKRESNSDFVVSYKLEIITPTDEIEVSKIHDLDIARDFVSRTYDNIATLVDITVFDYMELVYPNRENLKVRLTETMVSGQSGTQVPAPLVQEFTCKLVKPNNLSASQADVFGPSAQSKQIEVYTVDLQLIPEETELYRLVKIGGIIRDTPVTSLLAVIASAYGKLPVNIHEPTARETIGQLLIPEGLSVIDFPHWLQKEGGGVYDYNLGSYLLRGESYIYPLYDLNEQSTRSKITIANVSESDLPGVESTWLYNDDVIYIIANGQTTFTDNTEVYDYNVGNAVIFRDTNQLDESLLHSNGLTSVTEVGYVLDGKDKETINNIGVERPFTNNPHYELSKLTGNRGVISTVEWGNGNMSLIKPNMEVTMLYQDGLLVRSVKGIVIGALAKSVPTSSTGGGNLKYTTNVVLTLFLSNYDK